MAPEPTARRPLGRGAGLASSTEGVPQIPDAGRSPPSICLRPSQPTPPWTYDAQRSRASLARSSPRRRTSSAGQLTGAGPEKTRPFRPSRQPSREVLACSCRGASQGIPGVTLRPALRPRAGAWIRSSYLPATEREPRMALTSSFNFGSGDVPPKSTSTRRQPPEKSNEPCAKAWPRGTRG